MQGVHRVNPWMSSWKQPVQPAHLTSQPLYGIIMGSGLPQKEGIDMIEKDMTVGQVMFTCAEDALPDVIKVFTDMGMHCLYCPHSTGETLEQAAMVHGNDVDTLVAQLNEVYIPKE